MLNIVENYGIFSDAPFAMGPLIRKRWARAYGFYVPVPLKESLMKAVNAQTQFLLEKLRAKQKESIEAGKPLPSPFAALDMGRKALGREWDERTKQLAIEALAMWVVSLVAGMLTETMNEISAVGRFAANSKDEVGKKAALELATSMGFIEAVMKMFAEALDFEYIAEQLFEDGQKAAESAEPAPSKFAEKYKPSAN